MRTSTVKACIFDLDGVIVDSAKYHFLSWQRLAKELGIDFTEAQNDQLKGVSRQDSLKRILSWGGIERNEAEQASLMARKNGWYLEFIDRMGRDEILPGVEPFLQALREAGLKVGLGSSSKNARRILEQLNLTRYFDALVDGTDIARSKPDPEVFLLGAEKLGLAPSEIVVFEDAVAGIEAAEVGGFIPIGVGEPESLPNAPRTIRTFVGLKVSAL